MNDGVKILLERMKTHPEEFYCDHNRWSEIINRFEKYFNASERALVNGALTNIRREEFTSIVMQKLLDEPVKLDKETYTFQRREVFDTNTAYTDALREAVDNMRVEQLKLAAQAYKEELKNKSAFEKIKGKKYP